MAIVWDADMLAALRRLRSTGEPLLLCAEQIGVGYATAVYKARELGLAKRLNRGRRPGRIVAKERRTHDEASFLEV